jgi:hypothetical protein
MQGGYWIRARESSKLPRGEGSVIMHSMSLGVGAFAAVILVTASATAQGPAWPQVGMLNCRLNPSIGFIIAGHQSMECRFTPNEPEPPQSYEGAINTIGLDLGFTTCGALGWAVFAPTVGAPPGSLTGEYVGVSGDVGIGVGGGANVLVGESGRTFALQPLSLEGSVGINVSLGVSALKLRPAL